MFISPAVAVQLTYDRGGAPRPAGTRQWTASGQWDSKKNDIPWANASSQRPCSMQMRPGPLKRDRNACHSMFMSPVVVEKLLTDGLARVAAPLRNANAPVASGKSEAKMTRPTGSSPRANASSRRPATMHHSNGARNSQMELKCAPFDVHFTCRCGAVDVRQCAMPPLVSGLVAPPPPRHNPQRPLP